MLHERIFLDPTDDRVFIDTYVANDKSFKRDAMIVIRAAATEPYALKERESPWLLPTLRTAITHSCLITE